MKSRSGYLIFFAVAGFLVFSFLYLIMESEGEEIKYITKNPFKTDIVVKTLASGIIIPKDEVEIKSKVSGIVEEIYVRPGQKIEKGDLLARIKIIPNMVELSHAESRLNQAKIAFEDAERILERQKRLFDAEVISETDFLKYKSDFNKSKEERTAAEDHLQLILKGIRKHETVISNTMITSSISGTVQEVVVKKGGAVIESNSFNDGTTITSIANMNEMLFEGHVSETEIGRMKPGDKLSLFLPALRDDTLTATLDYISPKGADMNGTVKFRLLATIDHTNTHFIRSGYSANAEMVLERKNKILAIEEAWIKFQNDDPYVEVETSEGVFTNKRVKLGISDGINTEVISGLKPEDKIKI
jgi:HlyD family secretion protein